MSGSASQEHVRKNKSAVNNAEPSRASGAAAAFAELLAWVGSTYHPKYDFEGVSFLRDPTTRLSMRQS